MFESLFPSHWTTLKKLMWLKLKGASAVWSTVFGNPVSFTAIAAPLKQLQIAFSPVQSGTGDPSPDNVRPISGWDGVTVWRTGKNLVDPATKERTSKNVAQWCYANGFMLRAGQTYTLSSDTAGTTVYIEDKATGTTLKIGGTVTYTPTQDTLVYFRAYFAGGIADVNLQLELGTTATDYQPYNSRSISISFGSTVYSGYVDVLTGVVTVDMAEVNAGTLNWTYVPVGDNVPNPFFYAGISGMKTGSSFLCSAYKYIGRNYQALTEDKSCAVFGPQSNRAAIRDDDYTDGTTFKNAVNGVQLVYELATPITIQLTPEQVNSLAGENVAWASTNGDMEITYRSA